MGRDTYLNRCSRGNRSHMVFMTLDRGRLPIDQQQVQARDLRVDTKAQLQEPTIPCTF